MSDEAPSSGPGERAGEGASPRQGDAPADALFAWALAASLSLLAWRYLPDGWRWPVSAGVWALVPIVMTWRREGTLAPLGLVDRRPVRSVLLVTLAAAVTLPPFALGFGWWFDLDAVHVASAGAIALATLEHLLRAGLPEEIFFRGFVQSLLCQRYGGGSLPGLPHLHAVALAAALFAVTHVLYVSDPLSVAALLRLSTFFPGLLFGLLYEWTGSIWAPALFHALCNAFSQGLSGSV